MSTAVSPPVFDAPSPAALQSAVLDWFAIHGRALNFRRTRDPYSVLVSEVIAQQTQIARVEPAWEAFMARFPTVGDLAAASTADVLRQWQGLGYNRRALNLQRAARLVVEEYDGVFPADMAVLAALPGIGPYTARAVAAIAFGQRAGAVDTNVRRVLGRTVLGEAEAVAGPRLQALADHMVPEGRAGEWTHALMDIGAGFCRPRAPHCDGCPLAGVCRFRALTGGMVGWSGALQVAAAGSPTEPMESQPRSKAPGAGSTAGAAAADAATRGTTRPPRATPATPFPRTTRWLRGRLLDLARATADGDWSDVPSALGDHHAIAIARAAAAMAAEGLLELHPTQPGRMRLPQ